MVLEFIKSPKGKDQLKLDNHLFGFHMNMSTGNHSWKCVNYTKTGCLARVHTNRDDEYIVQETGEHNHAASAAKVGAKIMVNQLRQRAVETQEAPAQMIATVTAANNLDMLVRSRHWYCDGTFKTAPPLFKQLYTVHGYSNENVMPAIYALLPNKQGATYSRLFAELKVLRPNLSPVSIMSDFELAAINSFRAEFPQSQLRGCFFHHNQSVWRKLQDLGLARRYEDDEVFAFQAKMLPSLAFVPPEDVVRTFEILTEGEFLPAELDLLVDYFEDTWIGRRRGNVRRIPAYPIDLWNCHGAVVQGLAKTNNSCEGWHRGFLQLVGAEHPSIWKFIDYLRRDQSVNEMRIEQYIAGQPPAPSRRRYRDCAERISRIVGRYNNGWLNDGEEGGLIDYLRGLSHNYDF